MDAMKSELQSIEKNKLVPRPGKRKVIGVKWGFKTKYKCDGFSCSQRLQVTR